MAKYMTNVSDKSKTTTLILVLVLGYVGGHDFYLGNIGKGLLKFFTLNIAGIGWIIDIVKVASGGYQDNTGAPVRIDHKDK